MPSLSPCSHREFVAKLTRLGYDGPFAGGRHMYMTKKGAATVRVPNPHRGDISLGLIKRILRIANIDQDQFINAETESFTEPSRIVAARLSARWPTCCPTWSSASPTRRRVRSLLEQAREHAGQLGHLRSKLEEKERELQSVTEALKRFR